MKLMKLPFTKMLALGVASLLTVGAAHAQDLLTLSADGSVGEYTTSGGLVNASLITGLSNAQAFDLSGNSLIVSNQGANTIQTYALTGSGATLTATETGSFAGPGNEYGVTTIGGNIYVASYGAGSVTEYSPTGTVLGTLTGLGGPVGLSTDGTNLFVGQIGSNVVGEYTSSLAPVNASLVTGFSAYGVTVNGSDIFTINNSGSTTIGEFTLSGTAVNSTLITNSQQYGNTLAFDGSGDLYASYWGGTGVDEYAVSGGSATLVGSSPLVSEIHLNGVAFLPAAVPEPSTWAMLLGGLGLLAFCARMRRTQV
jgi:hypothetical protein